MNQLKEIFSTTFQLCCLHNLLENSDIADIINSTYYVLPLLQPI